MGVFLEGKRVLLRTVERADLYQLAELISDRNIGELTGEVHPMTEKGMDEFYDRCQRTEDRIWFLIVDKESGRMIGETGFLRMFMPWRTSDFSLVIWDRNFWGNGYGKEVSELMLDYGFQSLNLNRLAIGVVGFNETGLKFWKSIGFREEGRQVDGYFCRGKYSDFIMMYLLQKDYCENKSFTTTKK